MIMNILYDFFSNIQVYVLIVGTVSNVLARRIIVYRTYFMSKVILVPLINNVQLDINFSNGL